MATALWIMVVWFVVSLPLAILVGKAIAHCSADDRGHDANDGTRSPAGPSIAADAACRAEA